MKLNALIKSFFLFAVIIITPLSTQAALPAFDSQGQALPTLAPIMEKTTPAVVNIATKGFVRETENPLLRDPFFRFFFDIPDRPKRRQTQSLGSGVIINAKRGYVVTNHHVIDKAAEIQVTLKDGRSFQAKLIGTDPDTDVAIIQIPGDDLTALPLADSDDLRVGDFVVAIGNPFGLSQTVTSGIVSALNRSGLGIEGYENFIQTDASINPGNSGGALINLRGQLVGINTAILAPSGGNVGIGFAIPTNMMKKVMDQLVKHGEVKRGQLGIYYQDLSPDLAAAFDLERQHGVIVSKVASKSHAAKAGLKVGDIILSINGQAVQQSGQLESIVALMEIGEKTKLKILRDGRKRTIKTKVEAAAEIVAQGETIHPIFAGATLSEFTPASPAYEQIQGILITDIALGSPAWRSRLRRGDILLSVNREQTRTLEALRNLMKNDAPRFLLNIQRRGESLFLLIR